MVGLIISIIISFLAFLSPKSKILAIALMSLMVLLWGWNTYNGDYESYQIAYEQIPGNPQFPMELGFKFIVNISNDIGLDYQDFLKVYALICIGLLSIIIFSLSSNCAVITAVYFWAYFPLDYVLIRNTLSFLLIGLGLVCYLKQIKYRYILLTIFILLGCLFHLSSLIYLLIVGVLLFAKKMKSRKLLILILSCTIVTSLIIVLQSDPVISPISRLSDKSSSYTGSVGIFVIITIWQIILYILSSKVAQIARSCKFKTHEISTINKLNIILFIITPLYLVLGIASRIFRNLSFITSIYTMDEAYKKILPKRWLVLFFVFILFFIINYFIVPVSFDTIEPLFFSNSLFGRCSF